MKLKLNCQLKFHELSASRAVNCKEEGISGFNAWVEKLPFLLYMKLMNASFNKNKTKVKGPVAKYSKKCFTECVSAQRESIILQPSSNFAESPFN